MFSQTLKKASKFSYVLKTDEKDDEVVKKTLDRLIEETNEDHPAELLHRIGKKGVESNVFFFVADESFYKKVKLNELDIREGIQLDRYRYGPRDIPFAHRKYKLFIPIPEDMSKSDVETQLNHSITLMIDLGIVEKKDAYVLRFPETKEGVSPRFCHLEFFDEDANVVFRRFFSFLPWGEGFKYMIKCDFDGKKKKQVKPVKHRKNRESFEERS